MTRDELIAEADKFIAAQNPFVKGRPEIVMRKHWLLEFMADFAQQQCGDLAAENERLKAEVERRDVMLNAAERIEFDFRNTRGQVQYIEQPCQPEGGQCWHDPDHNLFKTAMEAYEALTDGHKDTDA